MSQAEVGGLAQDQAGYLWMTTLRGLNRFDGENFVSFTIAQGMRRNHLTALTVDAANRVWAGDSGGGVTLVDHDQVIAVIAPPAGPSSEVTGLVSVSREVALVATRGNGLWQLNIGTSTPQWHRWDNVPANIEQILATRQKIYLRAGQQLWTAALDFQSEFTLSTMAVQRIGQSSDGQIGIATSRGDGLYTGAEELPPTPVSDNLSLVLPGNQFGFWQVAGDQLIDPEGRTQQLPTSNILALFVDREGIVWLGTSKGLIRFLGFRFTHYSLSDSRDGRMVWSITQDASGRYWFGSDDALLTMHQGTLSSVNKTYNLPAGPVRDLLVDRDGILWVAVRGEGLYQIAPDSTRAQLAPGTGELELLDLTETPDGGIWLSTLRSGVMRLDKSNGQLRRSNLPRNSGVYTITASGDNEIWAGVSNVGVLQISLDDAGGLGHRALPGGESLMSPFIGQISMTGPSAAWVSTADGGVFRYRAGNVQNIAENTPLASQNVYMLHAMTDGSLMVGADAGLYQIDLGSQGLYRHYRGNGFIATESNVHATYVDNNGDVWIGTVAGATRINPSLPIPRTPQLSVEIVQVETGTGNQLEINTLPIKPEDGGVTFGYRAISLLDPSQVEYSHMLGGLESAFSEPTSITSMRYSSLASGDFEFQVRARLAGNPWSTVTKQRFTVLPPIWRRPWFLALAGLVTILMIFGFVQLRTRQIASVNHRLREEVADRTRSIEEARQRLEESNRLLEYQANYDELTGMLNRRSFEKTLNEVWSVTPEKGSYSYLMFMDLDQFKIVNDTCGHAAGDQLLCEVANIIAGSIQSNDTLGRLGGDEFGLIVSNRSREAALEQAEKVRAAIEDLLFTWESQIFRIGVSIGCVPIDSQRGDLNELQQIADAACYAAKEAGRNQVHLVEGEKDLARAHRGEMRWVQRLHDAMDNNLFALFGQKIVPLTENINEPERMEILLRMRDMTSQKLIPPGAFLPAAERYGLGIKLDEWVVSNLLKTLFLHESFHAEGRRYWVNLSGASVGDPKFCAKLLTLMGNSQLPPGMVNFEITETAVIRSVSEAARLISALKEMGCAFALDDFGSGLSSFGYLKRLKVDFLKIDGMFIRDIVEDKTDQIFVKSIIDIAHSLGIKTIVEFVENDEILEVVRSLGADYGQGFGIHRPELLMPAFPHAADISNPPPQPQKLAGVTS